MEQKGLTCKIPLDLHKRISEEMKQQGLTMGKFIEMLITEHYNYPRPVFLSQRRSEGPTRRVCAKRG